ncbi:NAD(P)-binding domain-containing protein [Hoyosella rhizosphaerae]|uniref:Monooxygenase n=1 Tax=Hoyosella rhizosphaerae TaxID=1755582 RepID=A0A916ULG6_9ACTN|nr:NAD(P)/FAD-dependent oxidoreductase [Hoyosella rhizosphaerae]MBN4925412.1 NAD(P)-binding domain-containing protein [Hoyosella rhizosphaerae]GGC75381.1 monooxygenase [Hoyosella rhizosphaerae]
MSESNPTPLPTVDALVIGAGPAGIGAALALQSVDSITYGVIDRGGIGQTYMDWNPWTRFLTPSFTGNAFGAIDLNAIHPETSPALLLQTDYPSGEAYAHYLRKVTELFKLPVVEDTAVEAVSLNDNNEFVITTARGELTANNVVWAGGEFSSPNTPEIPGAEHGIHSSQAQAWEPAEQSEVTVIGGYESGIDMACSLTSRGHTVTVLDPKSPWEVVGSDPSLTLSPRTRQRLRIAQKTDRLTLVGDASATSITVDGGQYVVTASNGNTYQTQHPPVFATGYHPHLGPVAHMFESRDDGWPLLNSDDESTIQPGLFLSGPAVRHKNLHLCFIYKFRQRFAHIAHVIGTRGGYDTTALKAWKSAGMWVEDVSCCDKSCVC